MKEKDVLNFSCVELVSLFEREFPTIMQGASLSKDWTIPEGVRACRFDKIFDFFVYKTIFPDVYERDPAYS